MYVCGWIYIYIYYGQVIEGKEVTQKIGMDVLTTQ